MTEYARNGGACRRGAGPWVVASLGVALAGSAVAAAGREPAAFAVAAPLVLAVLVAGWRVTGSRRLGWLLLFGAVFGVLELAVDWYHVARLGAFVYRDYGGLRVAVSPWYMPLGWAGLVAQFGYGALWVAERVDDRGIAVAAAGVAGIALPPFYEQFAAAAGAWHYPAAGVRVFDTPVWVAAGYGLTMAVVAATVLALYRPGAWKRAVAAAVVAAGGMFAVSVAVYELAAG